MPEQIHLAAQFPGVGNTVLWSDPAAGSQIAFSSFQTFAEAAERGKLDFIFFAEGLRLREQHGLIYDLDIVGRPDTFTILAALAAVTSRLGLVATINTTFNEPYEVARQVATLDHLSAGRAGWNVVTSSDAFTGANFRRGGYLDLSDRYTRARAFLQVADALWDDGRFQHQDRFFDIQGTSPAPRPPQGRPVIFQAGDSEEGRELAAESAGAIYSRHSSLEAGRAFSADVKGRLARHGRRESDLLVMPGATFVVGDTDAEAKELAHEVRRAQVSPQTALVLIEQLWNTRLPGFDVDGPLPAFDPVEGNTGVSAGRASSREYAGRSAAVAADWRGLAEAKGLSAREVVIELANWPAFVGSPETVATEISARVDAGAADGYILTPHLVPGGLDVFVDRVVPILQERGRFRADYTGPMLRDHLGLRP